jgi:hypothetical protein
MRSRQILPQSRWDGAFASGLPCQASSEGTPQSVARGAPQSGDRAAAGMSRPRLDTAGAQASRSGVASSSGRDCSALRGATQSVVRGALRSGDRVATGRKRTAPEYCWVAYIPLRGRIFLRKKLLRPSRSIRVVAFRASHSAKPPSRQRRLVQDFPRCRFSIGCSSEIGENEGSQSLSITPGDPG